MLPVIENLWIPEITVVIYRYKVLQTGRIKKYAFQTKAYSNQTILLFSC